jgi:DNA-directed RNA polymerase subunit N (RpoN/RPB10)
MEWTDNELQEWKKYINNEDGTSINPRTKRKIKNNGNIYKNLEKEFEKRLCLNNNIIGINDDISYPFTMPIRCFSCNTSISCIGIFNKLWRLYINNIINNMEYIDEKLDNIEKSKMMKEIKNNWWQKIGGFEEIRDNIKIDFVIKKEEWINIGIENLCCRRMIYTHQENQLFVYGPDDFI